MGGYAFFRGTKLVTRARMFAEFTFWFKQVVAAVVTLIREVLSIGPLTTIWLKTNQTIAVRWDTGGVYTESNNDPEKPHRSCHDGRVSRESIGDKNR